MKFIFSIVLLVSFGNVDALKSFRNLKIKKSFQLWNTPMKNTLTPCDDIYSTTLILSNTNNYDKGHSNSSANSDTTHPTFELVTARISNIFGPVSTIIRLSLLVFIISGCNIPAVNAATTVAENNFDQWTRYSPLVGTIFAAFPLSLLVNAISGSNTLQISKIDESMKRSEKLMKRSEALMKKIDELVKKLELSINDSVKKSEESGKKLEESQRQLYEAFKSSQEIEKEYHQESLKKLKESQRQAYEAFKSSQETDKQCNREMLSESSKYLISLLQLPSQRIDNAIDKK